MDIQFTDFENTCLIVLLGLMVNVMNHFDVDFIIPVSLSDENMQRAHQRDAILNQKFWVKLNCIKGDDYHLSHLHQSDYLRSRPSQENNHETPVYEELYVHEILGGNPEKNYPGIYSMIRKFMDHKAYA